MKQVEGSKAKLLQQNKEKELKEEVCAAWWRKWLQRILILYAKVLNTKSKQRQVDTMEKKSKVAAPCEEDQERWQHDKMERRNKLAA